MFDVSVQYIQSVHCLYPIGRLETTQSKHFEDTIKKCLERETFLVINFSACPYLSSSGIRVLLNTSRELASAGGQLVLTGLSSEMLQVLQIAGLDSVFEICADDVQAVTCIEQCLSLIHISEPTRLLSISYAVFCLKKKQTLQH